jgi:TolB-like protein
MAEKIQQHIRIDLNQFKLHIDIKNKIELTLLFDSPSRRFYLSLIAFVINQMKKLGKVTSIPLQEHLDLIVLLNKTVGSSAGSSEKENLLTRAYRKWKDALPNLEEAPLFRILGKKKEYNEGVTKTYQLTEAEKDIWANLFEYKGSGENVRLRFSIDRLGIGLEDVGIDFEGCLNGEAWERFISSLRTKTEVEPKLEPGPAIKEPKDRFSPPKKWKIRWSGRYRLFVLIALMGVVLGGVGLIVWRTYWRIPRNEVASIEKMAYPLPAQPSIALLPFANMSDDPKQEFICDGITESIITALSKVPSLFVIARSSTFTYKGNPVKVKQVSEELGVQYVLEGSVQRSGERIRIAAQLIDALTGRHIWTERYDCDLTDLFSVQDEITKRILTAIRVKLTEGEQGLRSEKYFKGKQGLDCYLKFLEGDRYLHDYNIDGTRAGKRILEEAIQMCPENPAIYVLTSWANYLEYWLGLGKSPQESIEKGIEMGQRALAIDDSLPLAHGLMSMFYTLTREYDKSIAEGERAVGLEPGGARAHLCYGMSLYYGGRPDEAIPVLQKAIRLNPLGETGGILNLSHAYRTTGRFEEAVSEYKKVLRRTPNNIFAHLGLAACYSMIGREEEAQAEAAEVLRLNPKFSVDSYARRIPFKDQFITDNLTNALRRAGLK